MKNIPSKLFLVIGTNEEQETDFNNLEHEYVCWSQDRTDESDIEYVSLSDRDQFAIGFAEWLKHSDYESLESTNNVHEYGNIWNNESMTYAISELLDLYKQSLTKTDKK